MIKRINLNRNYLIIIIVALFLFNLLWIYKNLSLTNKNKLISNESSVENNILYIPHFMVYDVATDEYINSFELFQMNKLTLLIQFSPYDCALCLTEKDFWKKISLKFPNISVVALSYQGLKDELLDWKNNCEIDFLLCLDSNAILKSVLEIEETPFKVLVNNQGKILNISHFYLTENEKNEYEDILTNFINTL